MSGSRKSANEKVKWGGGRELGPLLFFYLAIREDGPVDPVHHVLNRVARNVRVNLRRCRLSIEHLVVVVRLPVQRLALLELCHGILPRQALEHRLLPARQLTLIERTHANRHTYSLRLLLINSTHCRRPENLVTPLETF